MNLRDVIEMGGSTRMRKTLRINRKKMETPRWAMRKYIALLKKTEWLEMKLVEAHPFWEYRRRKLWRARVNLKRYANERKIRQAQRLMDRIGVRYK